MIDPALQPTSFDEGYFQTGRSNASSSSSSSSSTPGKKEGKTMDADRYGVMIEDGEDDANAARPSVGSQGDAIDYRSSTNTTASAEAAGGGGAGAAAGGPSDDDVALWTSSMGVLSQVPGYEGVPTEDAIVSSLASRQWARSHLAGPREEFRRDNHTISDDAGHGSLRPQQSPSAQPRHSGSGAGELHIAGVSSTSQSTGAGGPATHGHPFYRMNDSSEEDGGKLGAGDPYLAPIPLSRLDEPREQPAPSAPTPVVTPRQPTRQHTTRGGHRSGSGAAVAPQRATASEPYSHARSSRNASPSRYSHVRSIVADYRNGNISFLAAQHSSARNGSPCGLYDPKYVTPTRRATDSPGPRRPRSASAAPAAPAAAAAAAAPATPRGSRVQPPPTRPTVMRGASPRGAPRCASLIPERHRYMTREEQLEQQRIATEEAMKRRARVLEAERRREEEEEERHRRGRRGFNEGRNAEPKDLGGVFTFDDDDEDNNNVGREKGSRRANSRRTGRATSSRAPGNRRRSSSAMESGSSRGKGAATSTTKKKQPQRSSSAVAPGRRGTPRDPSGLVKTPREQPLRSPRLRGGSDAGTVTTTGTTALEGSRTTNPYAYRKKLLFAVDPPVVQIGA